MEDDPLTKAMAPPPDETEEQRNVRIAQEQEEKRISDEIDEELRKSAKKGPKPVKILLLGESAVLVYVYTLTVHFSGQSESGAQDWPYR